MSRNNRHEIQRRPSLIAGLSQELPIPPEVAARMQEQAMRQQAEMQKRAYLRDVFVQTWQGMYSHTCQELIVAGIRGGKYEPLSPDVCRLIARNTQSAASHFMDTMVRAEPISDEPNQAGLSADQAQAQAQASNPNPEPEDQPQPSE